MVEAAVVIPLLLLAVISLIYYGLFCRKAFMEQLEVQDYLLDAANGDTSIFCIVSDDTEVSGESKGLFGEGFYKSYKQRLYITNEELLIRGGGILGSIFNDE